MSDKNVVSRETQEAPASQASQMIAVIERAALSPEVDVDKMAKLLDMQERIFNKQAEISFNQAMVRAQNRMRPVIKDAANDHTKSMYARMETIDRQIRPIYTAEGFALSFGTEDSPLEKCIRIVCDCTHADGHVKKYHADVPVDMYGSGGKQNKTATHAFGSSVTYGQRYLTKLIFNIAIASEDDDGNLATPQLARKVTPYQAEMIASRLEKSPDQVREWFASAHGSPENVARKDFDDLMAYLNNVINHGISEVEESDSSADSSDT